MPSHPDEYAVRFENLYGFNAWPTFCEQVYHVPKVQPKAIQKMFTSTKTGNPMTRSSYYKWEARAWQVKELR